MGIIIIIIIISILFGKPIVLEKKKIVLLTIQILGHVWMLKVSQNFVNDNAIV